MTRTPIICELTSVTFVSDFSLMSFAATLSGLSNSCYVERGTEFSSATIYTASSDRLG